jgi:N-methylhydantoinase A
MLGILSTDQGFAGGSFTLTRDGVEAAFARIGADMGYSAEAAAFGCWRVVNSRMSQGVRRMTAGKGIEKVLVPKASPTFSALGTFVAHPRIDEERSLIARADALDPDKLGTLWHELAARAGRYFSGAAFMPEQVIAHHQFNMRYADQNFALTFDIQPGGTLDDLSFIDDGLGARAIAMFKKRHMAEYNHIREHEVPEITGVRLA